MAILKSIATGNFTSASTWATVVAYAAVNNLGATSAFPTTAYNTAPAFTSLSDTVTGVILQMGITNVTIAGTFTVELYNVTTATIVGTCTVNGSDLGVTNPNTTYGGWCFFKFSGGNVTLNAAQSYSIRYKASVNSMNFTVVRGAAATDLNRGLVTTTTKAPATNDTCHIMGDFISAGVSTTYTVTMDNTDSTLQLIADAGSNALTTNPKGILTWGTSAATNYYLKCAGMVRNYENSDMIISTSGTPMPSTSTATIEMVQTSSGQYGIDVAHNLTTYGASKTVSAKLNADAAVSATTLTTDISTGWLSGDTLGIAGTTRTNTELQKLTLSANASGTTLTTNALTTAKGGNSTTGVQADIINLTRNIKFVSNTYASYVYFPNIGQNLSLYYTEFKGFGTATGSKYALSFYSDGITADVRYCSFYDGNIVANSRCIYISQLNTGSINFQSCNLFNPSLGEPYRIEVTTGSNITFNNIIGIGGGQAILNKVSLTYTNITIANTVSNGLTINERNDITSMSNISIYGCAAFGFVPYGGQGVISNMKVWRNGSNGIQLNNMTMNHKKILIDGLICFGNNYSNIYCNTGIVGQVIINNATITPGTTLICPIGLDCSYGGDIVFFTNSTFGSGHTTGDLYTNGGLNTLRNISLFNCNFLSTIKLNIGVNARGWNGLTLTSINENGVAGSNFTYDGFSTQSKDAAIYNTSAPSFRITPNTSAARPKTVHTPVKLAVKSGDTPTISVAVRKSVVGDGTAYNGNQPRMILRPCIHAGVTDFTVITSGTSANGIWEILSGTLPAPTMDCVYEVYIDCDGTTGWINIDDWNTTYFKSTRGLGYWGLGAPFVEIDASKGLITSFFG